MRVFAILVLILTNVFGLTLKQNYFLDKNKILSTDIFDSTKCKFSIGTFGSEFSLTLPQNQIIEKFKQCGIDVKSSGEDVSFFYKNDEDFKNIQEQISNFYKNAYSKYNIQIKEILIKPIIDIPQNMDFKEAVLDDFLLKNSTSTILVESVEPKKSVPFVYEIKATIDVYKTTTDIKANEDFTPQNTTKSTIVLEKTIQQPAQDLEAYSARSYIQSNQIITQNKIKPKIIVNRGDLIEVSSTQDSVDISFVLVAMSNAHLNQIINARNMDSKKILKVKITGYKKGVLQ